MPLRPEHILLFFVDGLGIGDREVDCNPCCQSDLRFFNHVLGDAFPKSLPYHGVAWQLDACLDMAGLPQSATGQTALLTGQNAASALGRHLNGFPSPTLREIIARHSIFKTLTENGRRAAFLNAFRPPFFDYNPHDIIRFLSVTTVCNLYAGLPFFNLDDLRAGRSVYQDMTGEWLKANGFDVPLYTPEQAGAIIGRRSQDFHFSLFEYFQTDRAGHAQDMERARKELIKLDRFLDSVLQNVDLETTGVMVTSDHGNIENVCQKGHTRNPAMTLAFGRAVTPALFQAKSILDVTPYILDLLNHDGC
jgi:hypothetical protein